MKCCETWYISARHYAEEIIIKSKQLDQIYWHYEHMSVRSVPSMSSYTHLNDCRHWTKKCSVIFLWSMPGWLMQSVAVQFPLRDVTEWPNAPINGIPNMLYHRYVWRQSRLIHGWNTLQGFLCYDRSMNSGIILLDSVSDGTQEGYDNRIDHSVYILTNSNCVVSNYQRR